MQKQTNRLVYSTDQGRLCPECGKPSAACICKKPPANRHIGDGIVRIARETKGRSGKGVSLITGLDLDEEALAKLAKELKQLCGTGGAVKDGIIEIQGDKREQLKAALEKKGFKVKLSGG